MRTKVLISCLLLMITKTIASSESHDHEHQEEHHEENTQVKLTEASLAASWAPGDLTLF